MATYKGYIKWYDFKKGFGIIVSDIGETFLHHSVAGKFADQLAIDVVVEFDYMMAYNKKTGGYAPRATQLFSVEPLTTFEILDTVKLYDPRKGYGFVYTGLEQDAFLHSSVCKAAGVFPDVGMPMRAIVERRQGKLAVKSFIWGEEVEAAYRELHADADADDSASEASSEPASLPELSVAPDLNNETTAPKKAKKTKSAKSPSKKSVTTTKKGKVTADSDIDLRQLVASGKPNGSLGEQLKAAATK